MSFLSVAAVAAALAVAGAWMLLQANTQLLLAGFEQRVEVVAYLRTGLAPEAVSATASALAALPGVRSMELVSPDEAARALSRDPELKKYLEVLGATPCPPRCACAWRPRIPPGSASWLSSPRPCLAWMRWTMAARRWSGS